MLPERKRIGDNYLRGDKVDDDTVTSAEFNELETVVKEAVNANYSNPKKQTTPLHYMWY